MNELDLCMGLWLVECLSAAACMPSSCLLYWFLCLFFCTWVVQHHELVIFSVSFIKVSKLVFYAQSCYKRVIIIIMIKRWNLKGFLILFVMLLLISVPLPLSVFLSCSSALYVTLQASLSSSFLPNSAIIGYATEELLLISLYLCTDAVT